MEKKTKIVATVSDRKCDIEFIQELVDAGINVVRLNTAHQNEDDTLKVIENVRKVSGSIAFLLDTKGPEIRTAKTDFVYPVEKGTKVKVMGDSSKVTDENCVYLSHDNFVNEVEVGQNILIDDGELELNILEKNSDHLICVATNKGAIKGKKSINVPNGTFSLPALTQKDREYIEFAIKHDLDFVAHSFVRNKEDVKEVQDILDAKNSRVKIIAKIENQEGVDNIDEIIECTYGIMVARGDLAIEIPYEKIPGTQKKIINKCIEARKPVIVATQMLHSMIHNPRPTRAEVTDIANAIYSKTDAIMLSGETAYGDYPVEAVKTMSTIAKEVEKSRGDFHKTAIAVLSSKTSAYMAKSAVEASIKLDAAVIIADTSSGRTLRNLAGFRGRKPVYCQCYDKRVMRELALSFGIFSNYLEAYKSKEFIKVSLDQLSENDEINDSSRVVVIGGNFGISHGASFIEISTVDNLKERYGQL